VSTVTATHFDTHNQ